MRTIVLVLAALAAAAGCSRPATKEEARRAQAGSAREKRDEEMGARIDALGSIADAYRKPDEATSSTGAVAGMSDYEDAKSAVANDDLPRAIASLKKAAAASPQCAEFWYNLGAAQANHAIAIVNDDEDAAVRAFTDSVDNKRRSLDLMKQDSFCFYDSEQKQQVRSDAEQALQDADAVLADRASLVQALHLYAGR